MTDFQEAVISLMDVFCYECGADVDKCEKCKVSALYDWMKEDADK